MKKYKYYYITFGLRVLFLQKVFTFRAKEKMSTTERAFFRNSTGAPVFLIFQELQQWLRTPAIHFKAFKIPTFIT